MGNTNKALTTEEIDQLKSSTRFSGPEISDWYHKFYEDFPKGVITKKDFVKMYDKLFPAGDAKRFADFVFKSYDKDGNGEIDFKEFLTTVSVSSRGSPQDKLKWAFDLYDMDNDGSVSLTEVAEMIAAIYRLKGQFERGKAEEVAEKVFKQLDKNKDESLTSDEFVSGISNSKALMAILQGNVY